jgi:coenzyme F420-reducing hydrogenase alpha subunit
MKDGTIHVHYLTRVEGHGNIHVEVEGGALKAFRWEIPEAPRFFEAMVRGQSYADVAHIVSRICGICSIGHTLCALQAVENALGVRPSEQTVLLRKLLLHGETVQSHVLHAGYLAAPDFFGVPSVVPLVASHREAVLTIVRLHRLANEWCDQIGGRTTHPITPVVNGWTRLPTPEELANLRARIEAGMADAWALVEIFRTLDIPDFQRPTEYIALKHPEEYAFYEGVIASTDGDTTAVPDYRQKVHEFVVPYSTSKRARANRNSFAVGALARFNNNAEQLSPQAKKAAEALGLRPICTNPFLNTVAQVVEVVHALEDSLRLIDLLLARGIEPEVPWVQVRAGRGVGAVEVPRGILFHEYTLDETGHVVDANMIIPTGQNHQNIEDDMAVLIPQILDRPEEEIRLRLEMLVRAYDPCISCSTHLLHLELRGGKSR